MCLNHSGPHSDLDASVGVAGRVPVRTEDPPAEHGANGMQEHVAALLDALEARYTLIYRGSTPGTVVPRSGGDEGTGLRGSGGGDCVSELVAGGSSWGGACNGSSPVCGADGGRVAPSGAPLGGLELTLVSGGYDSGCFQGGGGGSAAREGRGGGRVGDGGKWEDIEGSAVASWLLDHAVASLVDAIPPVRREAS